MADLKTIITITQDELKRQTPTESAVLATLEALSAREADVLNRRFGLRGGATQTLAKIGQDFGITRERVRQIESQGIKKFRGQLTKQPLRAICKLATDLIRQQGGLAATAEFEQQFLPANQQTESASRCLAFLMDHADSLLVTPEDKRFRRYYALSPAHQQALVQIAPLLAEQLKNKRQPLSVAALHEAVAGGERTRGVQYLLSDAFIDSVLEIGRDFVATTDGTWGLASWPSVNPRNIRDKTLYVMKRIGTPLHFTDITKRIEQARFDHKKVTTQAVHNELINGDEFVLIGRGIYALGEWGYIPGTVADVIRAVLRKATTPLDREQIVSEVLKQRHVSRNTILINLQEKGTFQRVDKHSYQLAPARANVRTGRSARTARAHPGEPAAAKSARSGGE